MVKNKFILTGFFIVLLLLLCPPLSAEGGDSDEEGTDNGTVLAVYVIGSTLEFDPENLFGGGAATKDITEIVTGYSNGTTGLDVFIAYGGSQKPGWNGMTITTPDRLREDLKDGSIDGNCSFLEHDEEANMADNGTLTHFLQYIGTRAEGKRILLVFWDHGGAWKGFGYDENHIDPVTGEPDYLTIIDLRQAFSDAGYRYGLIGFDACLMANLEVVSAIAPYGEVFIGSEDLMPGFGWDWETVLQKLVENPGIQTKELGRVIVDAYLDNPNHTSEGKTLSCIDLSKVKRISDAFNTFSSNLGNQISDPSFMQKYSNAVLKVKAFGTDILKGGETFEFSVDMTDYLSEILKSNPNLSKEVTPILDDLNQTIFYARQDGSRPNSNGLSIYSPYTAILVSQDKVDPPPQDLLTGYYELLEEFVGELRKENRRIPDIIEDRSGYTVPDNASVSVELQYLQNTNESLIILGTEPAYPDKPGHYPFPKWGGWGIQWIDEKFGQKLVIPVNYMGNTATGRERYKSYGKVTRNGTSKKLQFDFYFEPHTGDVSYYITPYTVTGKNTPIYERNVWIMEPGDNLTVLATYRLQGSLAEEFKEYGSITWTEATKLGYAMLPCGYTYTIQFNVFDVTRMGVYQDFRDIDVPCQNVSGTGTVSGN